MQLVSHTAESSYTSVVLANRLMLSTSFLSTVLFYILHQCIITISLHIVQGGPKMVQF